MKERFIQSHKYWKRALKSRKGANKFRYSHSLQQMETRWVLTAAVVIKVDI